MKSNPKDNLFTRSPAPERFEFNEPVARVFDDMLERSIPLYRECQAMVVRLCRRFAREGTNLYDLGCSTGTLLVRLAESLPHDRNIRLIGVDNSAPMLEQTREKLKDLPLGCDLVEADLEGDFLMTNASVVLMNYTLQFIPPARRPAMVDKIFRALNPGGCLILVEKVESEEAGLDPLFFEVHHEFKEERGYSRLEIARKREALENVLIPWKVSENVKLLKNAGFREVDVFFKWSNFAGLIALK